MKIRIVALLILISITGFISCNNDDDDDIIEFVENDRTEQQIIDNDSIIGYLETHYYNSDAFTGNSDPSISDLIITELISGESVPDGSTLLKDAVETISVVYKSVDTSYDFYVLRLNQGGGNSLTFADDVRVLYEGFLIDGTVFDKNDVVPTDFDLIADIAVEGWRRVLPLFNTAESVDDTNGGLNDGTVNYINNGVGVMFLPSGLAYFSSATTGTSYAPLIFKFELLQTEENDHDGDGVPSYLEDLDGDGEFYVNFDDLADVTDDDTDGDGFANFNDTDDDNDGILTINEDLEDTDLNVDSDGDGDPTNDKDGDGDPTNDDTDGDGIPNYLDADDTESNA